MDLIEMKHILMICSLADCTEEVAREAYLKTNDVLLAVDFLLFQTELPTPRKRKREDITPEEEHLNEVRKTMKNFDDETEKRVRHSTSDLPVCMEEDETPDLHEEMVLQNSCLQECHLPVIEEEAETRGTECPSHPECSCGSR